MKITYRTDYALKAIMDLAQRYERESTTIRDLSLRIDAPVKFLEQVLVDLKKGGFVKSRRGNVGGYALAKSPAEITVGEVVRFLDGSVEPIACVVEGYSNCADKGKCVLNRLWAKVTRATADIIDNVTFEQLVMQSNAEQQALTYSI